MGHVNLEQCSWLISVRTQQHNYVLVKQYGMDKWCIWLTTFDV